MNSFEINKIIAAIILTIVIVFGVNKLADVIYYVKAPEGNAYKIVTETEEIYCNFRHISTITRAYTDNSKASL